MIFCIVITLTFVGGVVLCTYLYGTRNSKYFKKAGVPHPEPIPLFGNVGGIFSQTTAFTDIYQEMYNLYPDAKYIGIYEFSSPTILLRDPELIKSIAIKNFDSFTNHHMFIKPTTEPLFSRNLFALKDAEWKNMRGILSPTFTSKKMKYMFSVLSKFAVDFADHLAKRDPLPENLDIKDTFGRYALDAIASVAFGLTVNSTKDRGNDVYLLATSIADFSISKIFKFIILNSFPSLFKLLDIRFLNSKIAAFLTKMIKTTIETRDAQGIVRPDMIQLMMQSKNERGNPAISLEDMTAQALIFLGGGFESVSTTMTFAALELALNPDVQRQLQEEIDEVLERSLGDVSYEDLHAMKYLDAVVRETLRLYPLVPVTDRVAMKNFTLPPALPRLEPFEVKPGLHILIPVYSIHRDPKYFPDPDRFDPERFSEGNKSKILPMTYFPFGLGPRICIAKRFSLMEVKLVLFHLLAKCNLVPTSKTQSPIKLSPKNFFLTSAGGSWLKIEPRKKAAVSISMNIRSFAQDQTRQI